MNRRQQPRDVAVRPGKPAMKEAADFVNCAERLKALADPDRLRIVQCLFDGPLTVSQIAARLGEEIVNVSHHLAILRRTTILQAKKQGRFVHYSIHPGVQIESLRAHDARQINLGCCQLDLTSK
jgi:ArsR family transcriptional regulator, nickel/cobalt-responsive transcriptional repressor